MNAFVQKEVHLVLQTLCRIGAGSQGGILYAANFGKQSRHHITHLAVGHALYKLEQAGLVQLDLASELWSVTNENMMEIFE